MEGCEELEQVYHQVTLSMILLKCAREFLFLLGYGSMFDLLNAGLVIILVKLGFFIS